jgi:putative DNA primase/helicase
LISLVGKHVFPHVFPESRVKTKLTSEDFAQVNATALARAKLGITTREYGSVEQRVPCPRCDRGSRDDALGVNIETGVFHCFRCGWKGRVRGTTTAPRPIQRIDDPATRERKQTRLLNRWAQAVPIENLKRGAVVCRYLHSRGLVDAVKSYALRQHNALPYWDQLQVLARYPALLAEIRDPAGVVVGHHATYLRADGCAKAPVATPRKIIGTTENGATRGAAIRIHPPRDSVLGIAEGIESALSLHVLNGLPVWSAISAGGLERVELPADIRRLYIAVDLDLSGTGERAAQRLAARMLGRTRPPEVYFVKPSGTAPRDLNDDLLALRAS